MKKWLGGCLAIGLVVIGMGVWSAWRKLVPYTGANRAETTVIAAPVSRVFASIANADSLSVWMTPGLGIRAAHHGMLVAGDTLKVGANGRLTFGAEPMKWIVVDVTPDQRFALQLRSDSSGRIIATRQFTIAAKGDSTLVTSAVSTPVADSIRANRSDTLKQKDAFIAGLSKMMMASLRMQSHMELEQLKNRIEGKGKAAVRR
ncbi:MAG TPA: SRPBCC family protein [Vicinamibacterales bacterium]|nr:SRPBCC family protein [Vicinamibacterales bacterium]